MGGREKVLSCLINLITWIYNFRRFKKSKDKTVNQEKETSPDQSSESQTEKAVKKANDKSAYEKQTKDSSKILTIDFRLNRPRGKRYRRPYVAVWLEDSEGFPVKTGLLFLQTEQPGPRWHRDLTRWYTNDRTRKLVEKKDLIGTISSATRGPGDYSAEFDGTDNLGKKLPDGTYTLCLEVAREHGTYQIIREPIELNGDKAIAKTDLKPNVEVSKVSYWYGEKVKPETTESKSEKPAEKEVKTSEK